MGDMNRYMAERDREYSELCRKYNEEYNYDNISVHYNWLKMLEESCITKKDLPFSEYLVFKMKNPSTGGSSLNDPIDADEARILSDSFKVPNELISRCYRAIRENVDKNYSVVVSTQHEDHKCDIIKICIEELSSRGYRVYTKNHINGVVTGLLIEW